MKQTLTDIATRLRRIAPLDDQDEPDEHSQVQAPSIDPDRLKTPLTPAAIERAQANVGELLESSDSSLVDRLNEVQEYVEGHEYVDRHGNAFFERLVEQDDDPDSLIEIVAVRDRTICFVCPGEVWAQVTHDLGLTDSESRAASVLHIY